MVRPRAFLASLACIVVLPLGAQQNLAGSRPNILFVFSDDHAAHAISAYGSRINQTPNIDRIARQGLLFRNNFCGNALCGPSRATILTGLHSHQNGFMRNGNTFDGDQPTFVKRLQQVGYQTAVIGKWHLTSDPQGFDHWMVLPDQGQYYNPDFLTKDGRVRMEGHATDITTDLALLWLEQRDPQRPFVLMCQHKAPHRNWLPAPQDLGLYRDRDLPEPPTLFDEHQDRAAALRAQEMSIARDLYLHYDLMVPPTAEERPRLTPLDRSWDAQRRRMTEAQRAAWDEAFAEEDAAFRREDPQGRERVRWMYQRYIKNYLRCVAGVDRSVGRLLDWLDAHPDVKQNTLVIYSSDQGFFLGDHGFYDKRWMYEESLRMPLVMSWPGHLPEGQEVTALTQNIDFAPTFVELAGAQALAGAHGTSLLPVMTGRPPADWRDAIYYHFYESTAVHEVAAHFGVRTDRHKLIRYYEPRFDAWELFDLQKDPQEMRSLADDPAYAEVRADLERRLAGLRARYGDRTGELGDGRFTVTGGIAWLRPEGKGLRVWANTGGGYALQPQELAGRHEFTTTLRSADGRQLRNGFLVFGGKDPRRQQVRAGIEFGARSLAIVGPGAGVREAAAIEWDGSSAVQLKVTLDVPARRIVAEAMGQKVEQALPPEWQAITAWGYGGSNAETVFGEVAVR